MRKDLLGIKELNAVINDFLSEFNVTARLSTDFAYWCDSHIIDYSIVLGETSTRRFMRNFSHLAPDIECDAFLASLFHELGHHLTIDLLDNSELAFCFDVKRDIDEEMSEAPEWRQEQLYQMYFDLPDEYAATMWAIDYMHNNVKKVADFWNKLYFAIKHFYEINEVEVA